MLVSWPVIYRPWFDNRSYIQHIHILLSTSRDKFCQRKIDGQAANCRLIKPQYIYYVQLKRNVLLIIEKVEELALSIST